MSECLREFNADPHLWAEFYRSCVGADELGERHGPVPPPKRCYIGAVENPEYKDGKIKGTLKT